MINKRNIIIILVVALVVGLIYYQQSLLSFLFKDGESAPSSSYINTAVTREISTLVAYDVPNGGGHNTRFSVFVDQDGLITDVKSLDELYASLESQIKLDEFSENLLKIIKGKKLSELENVDRVGTSSLTTNAFNSGLENLKSQI